MPEPHAPASLLCEDRLIDFLVEAQVTRGGANTDCPLAGRRGPFAFIGRPVLKLARRDVESDVAGFASFDGNAVEGNESANRKLHAIGHVTGRADVNLRHLI